jgi:hypothetical protein
MSSADCRLALRALQREGAGQTRWTVLGLSVEGCITRRQTELCRASLIIRDSEFGP